MSHPKYPVLNFVLALEYGVILITYRFRVTVDFPVFVTRPVW